MTKLTITIFLFGFGLSLLTSGCGGFSTEQVLSVEMYGVSKSPEGATGTRDPKFQIYQLLQVYIVSEDEESVTNLLDEGEEQIFRIVDREQLIYSTKIDGFVGNSYGSVVLGFATEVSGGDSEDAALTFNLSEPILTLAQPFAVEKSKNLTLQIKINWGYTLSDEVMTEPQYILSME